MEWNIQILLSELSCLCVINYSLATKKINSFLTKVNNTTYKKYYLHWVFAQTPPNSAAAAAVLVAAVCAEPVWGGVCPKPDHNFLGQGIKA